MANPEHLKILKQGVEAWNDWRKENSGVRPDLSGADLVRAVLSWANLVEAGLRGADLSQADLSEADLGGADLSQADLSQADLGGAGLRGADLSQADLGGANLVEAGLRGADLSQADLSEADLSGATPIAAELSEANLSGAILFRANLSDTNLSAANVGEADLGEANLSGADLSEADLTGAALIETVLGDTNLSGTRGLESCRHIGPSIVDHRTLTKSGSLPLEFLRGCGLSDWEIENTKLYQPNLTEGQLTDIAYRVVQLRTDQPVQFYSCFISYSSRDKEFVDQLYADLQNNGVRCWFAPEDLKIGARTRPAIDEAIRVRDKLLLILSEKSIASDWVEKEVETAFEEERRRKETVLFPIRLDNTVMDTNEAWAADIRRTRNIGDFRNWKEHDAYQKAFERLIRDLKQETESGAAA